MKALLGTKLGMTQIFDAEGNVAPVTLVVAGPCTVTQIKSKTTDGYNAIQLGFGESAHVKRPQQGHLKSANTTARYLHEFRIKDIVAGQDISTDEALAELGLNLGDKIDVTAFEAGDEVQVTGTSKGKGFAGTIKRHNFARGPMSHGSRNHREPGSIGSQFPQHVMKGMRMAGRMGGDTVTVKNLRVVAVDVEQGLLAIRGAVPGPKKGLVIIRGLAS